MAPKLVFAVRHGESLWNVQRRQYPSEEERYCNELYLPDCSITELGIQQSRDAGAKLNDLLLTAQCREGADTTTTTTTSQPPPPPPPEDSTKDSSSSSCSVSSSTLLVVSPLRRAIQTANGIMMMAHGGGDSGWPPRPHNIIVQPLATEVLTDSCDIGTARSDLQQEFPLYNFSHVPHEYWWWPYGRSAEETYRRLSEHGESEPESHILERIEQLRDFLHSVQETIVVLVCHSETIWWLTSQVSEHDGKRHGVWTENGEIVDVTAFVMTCRPPPVRSSS